MSLEEVKLSLKKRKLSGQPMVLVFLDHVVKLAIEPRKTAIQIDRLISFDGISLRSFDPAVDLRNRMTVRNQGKVSQSPKAKLGLLAEETLDAGTKIIGIGSVLQLRKIVYMMLKQGGLVDHDGTAQYKAVLRSKGQEIGNVVYTAYKHHSLASVPRLVIPTEAHVVKKPALVTKTLVNIDLTNAPVNKGGLVQVRMGANVSISHLSPDHGENVVISAFHQVDVSPSGDQSAELQRQFHCGSASLDDLGPFEYETIASTIASTHE